MIPLLMLGAIMLYFMMPEKAKGETENASVRKVHASGVRSRIDSKQSKRSRQSNRTNVGRKKNGRVETHTSTRSSGSSDDSSVEPVRGTIVESKSKEEKKQDAKRENNAGNGTSNDSSAGDSA